MKKLLSIVLAVSMILGMSVTAWANAQWEVRDIERSSYDDSSEVTSNKLKRINERIFPDIYQQMNIMLDDSPISMDDLTDLEVEPGSEIRVYLSPFMFIQSDNTTAAGNLDDPLSISVLNRAGVKVSKSAAGDDVAKISLQGDRSSSYISIVFTDTPGYDGVRFGYSVFLSQHGSRSSSTRFSVKGVIQAEETEADSSDDYVDISNGETIKARSNVRGIEVYLGEQCSIIANLTKNKTYSGRALTDILPHDERTFVQYSDLEYIYRLETVGLSGHSNHVKFDLDRRYYVYNKNGTYIGTSNSQLPYWTKYYLTTKKYESIHVVR